MLDTNVKGDFTLKELSGEELKSALARANKLKKGDEGGKPRAIKPIEQFTFNETTDILLEARDGSGALLFYIKAKKGLQEFCTKNKDWLNYTNEESANQMLGNT